MSISHRRGGVAQNPRAKDLPEPMNAEDRALIAEERGRPFEKGNTAAKARKGRLARVSLDREQTELAPEELRSAIRRGDRYRRARASELLKAFGFVSSGVGALLATEGYYLAIADYFMRKGAMECDTELLSKAAKLRGDARSIAMSAWQLCSLESKVQVDSKKGSAAMALFMNGPEDK